MMRKRIFLCTALTVMLSLGVTGKAGYVFASGVQGIVTQNKRDSEELAVNDSFYITEITDEVSMADNNSSCFNFRFISYT